MLGYRLERKLLQSAGISLNSSGEFVSVFDSANSRVQKYNRAGVLFYQHPDRPNIIISKIYLIGPSCFLDF